MKIGRTSIIVVATITAAAALAVVGSRRAKADEKNNAVQNATVHFAMPQPQPPQAGVPGSPDNASTHFLMPDDVTIRKGGTVTFVVNGGGHGIAIHEVNKKTTRDDIAADLCQGPATSPESDRRARNAVCNNTILNPGVDVNGVSTTITGTENLNYVIADAKGDAVIVTGFNLTAANSAPPTVIANPRVDDPAHSHRALATSGRAPGDMANPDVIKNNPAGAFLTGTAFNAATGVGTPGNRIQVQFNRTGRFLVICMNRAHALNDHMFGFVSVVGEGDDD
jgi:plastocyanin